MNLGIRAWLKRKFCKHEYQQTAVRMQPRLALVFWNLRVSIAAAGYILRFVNNKEETHSHIWFVVRIGRH